MRTYFKILILEDIPHEARLIERALQRGKMHFKAELAIDKRQFIEKLNHFVPDIILSDHALPQFNSVEALKISRELYPHIPFILVTGAVSEEFAVNILRQGADDYILKSDLSRLSSSVLQILKQQRLELKKIKSQQMLHEQNLQLKKLNKELDNFVYSVSHNLRAPLTSVMGLIELAFKEKKNEALLTDYLEMMRHSVYKLDNTLKEILEYSRNARLESALATIDFDKLINTCFENLRYAPNYGRIEKKIVIANDVECISDVFRVNLILSNLISNAIKYMDTSKERNLITITITASNVVSIEFRDNGIGIHESLLPNVFQMFYRATDKSEGAGLGLYIVKEAVEKLNGIIAVESTLGEGTKFIISFPNLYYADVSQPELSKSQPG
jgi:signal transduction histidine kinase